MSDSESSSLSSAPSSEKAADKPTLKLVKGKLSFGTPNRTRKLPPPVVLSPSPSPEREFSPPHQYALEDNPDIAILVMFRSRFAEAFVKTTPNMGPQDIERGLIEPIPTEAIENLLCGLLSLALNRKKPVERGHYNRALEDIVSSQKYQWPPIWGGKNPMPGTKTFSDLEPLERLTLLKTLMLWSLNMSEAIITMIREFYKQTRKEDDVNQPLSVQPWGEDTRKRKFYLIEGQNDTGFRVYQASPSKEADKTWWSVAGNIEEVKDLARDLRAQKGQAAHRFAQRITAAIPHFEDAEDKRKRKEYRQQRKTAFQRPDPGFSLYEGRTRGKRINYSFDNEDEDGNSRKQSPAINTTQDGPTMTSSGRQVRSRFGRSYGDPIRGGDGDSDARGSEAPSQEGRRRSGRMQAMGRENGGSNSNSTDDSDDQRADSGEEWNSNQEDVQEKQDKDELMSDVSEDSLVLNQPQSLIIRLKVKSDQGRSSPSPFTASQSARNPQQVAFNPSIYQYQPPQSTVHPASNFLPTPSPYRPIASSFPLSNGGPVNGAPAFPFQHPVPTQPHPVQMTNGYGHVGQASPKQNYGPQSHNDPGPMLPRMNHSGPLPYPAAAPPPNMQPLPPISSAQPWSSYPASGS